MQLPILSGGKNTQIDWRQAVVIRIQNCLQCLKQYLGFEIMAGAYEISCPDPQCEKEAIFQLDEIEKIVGKELTEKHKTFRLNTGKIPLDTFWSIISLFG